MRTIEEKQKAAYTAINDCWKLYKAYCGIQNGDDARWEQLVQIDAVNVQEKNGNSALIRGFVMGVLEQLENDAKEMDNETNN